MIAHLRGKLTQKSPTEIVIDVNGVGYVVSIPLSTFEKLDHTGDQVEILTYLHVREDAMQLFGFATEPERELFKLLISVSGIGPKMAQGILSGLSAADLREAILTGNIIALTSISGVGRKTAERIILELRTKLGRIDFIETVETPTSTQLKARSEALVALMSLGYTRANAEQALRTVINTSLRKDLSVEELIKQALQHATKS
jgi:Holliday junction DNA helicase RuvA